MLLRTTLLCSTTLFALPAFAQQPATTAPSAQPSAGALQFTTGEITVRRLLDAGVARALMSLDAGRSWRELQQPDDRLLFRLAQFDPIESPVQLPGVFAAPAGTRLHVVQFQTQVLAQYRVAIEQTGAEILAFLPASALYVRGDEAAIAAVRALDCVRWVGPLQNGFKLDDELRAFVQSDAAARDVNLVLAKKSDRATLAQEIETLGGAVTNLADGSTMIVARLTPKQLLQLLDLDTVVWADPAGEIGYDMDNARIQGGANYVETMSGGLYRGNGVRAEIAENFEETHPDFANIPGRAVVRSAGVASHGHCTAGIVGGAGAGNAAARGMMDQCTIIEGGYSSAANHYVQIQGSAGAPWNSMQITSSWGSPQTTLYTSVSQAVDDALFDFDMVRTQSQSNTGNQNSRPEAWPKNTISVGAVRHGNNASPADDNWTNGASIGPAQDGRNKPDVCAYYDQILTSDRTGASGYDPGNYYSSFSGTSGATPIVNGHVGIIQEMFTDGLFGNPLPFPATPANRYRNKAHMTTTKALLCNTAAQYTFSGTAADLTRTHQGWGFPSLSRLYDNRQKIVVLDEYDTLQVTQSRIYYVNVAPGTPELRVTMVYADPAGTPGAATQLINNLNLKVTRFADGQVWFGNVGLNAGNFSTTGGAPNTVDNVECVYLQNPAPGAYFVEVSAASIAQDAKVETPQVDADFALVLHPVGGGYQTQNALAMDLQSTGPGDLTFAPSGVPAAGWTDGYTALSFDTSRGKGFGAWFGVEADALTGLVFGTAASPGNLFHFTNTPGAYPFTSFTFPIPAIISLFAGFEMDASLMLFDAGGNVAAVSSVDRITLQ